MDCSSTKIVIDGGAVFVGSLDQFKDCFFSNATIETIKEWCEEQGYTFDFEETSK